MAKQIFERNCLLQNLTLFKFSNSVNEAKQILNSLADSDVTKIKWLFFNGLPEWWKDQYCFEKLIEIINKQQRIIHLDMN